MAIGINDQLTIPAGLLVAAGLSPVFVAQFALFVSLLLMWTITCGKIFKKICGLPQVVL